MKVENICVKTLITVNKKTTAQSAARLMLKYSIGSLVVVSDNQPVGIVTRGDLVTRVLNKKSLNIKEIELENIMSRELIKAEEDSEVSVAAQLMATHNVKHLLVVKSNLPQKITRIASLNLFAKKPQIAIQISPPMVGIISSSDILKRLDILLAEQKR